MAATELADSAVTFVSGDTSSSSSSMQPLKAPLVPNGGPVRPLMSAAVAVIRTEALGDGAGRALARHVAPRGRRPRLVERPPCRHPRWRLGAVAADRPTAGEVAEILSVERLARDHGGGVRAAGRRGLGPELLA